MPRKKADGEQAAPARPKRTASQVLSPEQCEYLEAYATTHPDWDHRSVPDEIWESKKFPVFTKPQLAKRISNFFVIQGEHLRTSLSISFTIIIISSIFAVSY